jgi:hypothetical protein
VIRKYNEKQSLAKCHEDKFLTFNLAVYQQSKEGEPVPVPALPKKQIASPGAAKEGIETD